MINILIIDDDKNTRFLLYEVLKMNNFNVFQANNGLQGLNMLEKERIDLIIVDIMMPEMNGGNLLAEIRKQENGLCRESDVVLLSANVFGGNIEFDSLGVSTI